MYGKATFPPVKVNFGRAKQGKGKKKTDLLWVKKREKERPTKVGEYFDIESGFLGREG